MLGVGVCVSFLEGVRTDHFVSERVQQKGLVRIYLLVNSRDRVGKRNSFKTKLKEIYKEYLKVLFSP